MTPALHCASMLMSVSLRRLTFALQEEKKETEDTGSEETKDKKTNEVEVSVCQ